MSRIIKSVHLSPIKSSAQATGHGERLCGFFFILLAFTLKNEKLSGLHIDFIQDTCTVQASTTCILQVQNKKECLYVVNREPPKCSGGTEQD